MHLKVKMVSYCAEVAMGIPSLISRKAAAPPTVFFHYFSRIQGFDHARSFTYQSGFPQDASSDNPDTPV
jgi:hypothetical protein